jgi:hypothetical protein
MKYFLTWLALVAAVSMGLGSFNVPAFYRLTSRGVASPATVVEILPKIHNTVRYNYSIGGHSFHGSMQSWPPNPVIGELKVGQEVVIYYDREHPDNSALGAPNAMLENELASVILAALIVPTLIVLRIRWWIRRSRAA